MQNIIFSMKFISLTYTEVEAHPPHYDFSHATAGFQAESGAEIIISHSYR